MRISYLFLVIIFLAVPFIACQDTSEKEEMPFEQGHIVLSTHCLLKPLSADEKAQNKKIFNQKQFQIAVRAGHSTRLLNALNEGADVNEIVDYQGFHKPNSVYNGERALNALVARSLPTILIITQEASFERHKKVFEILISAHADVNGIDGFGKTPLRYAAENATFNNPVPHAQWDLEHLLAAGALPDVCSEPCLQTPLFIALSHADEKRNRDVIIKLLLAGSDSYFKCDVGDGNKKSVYELFGDYLLMNCINYF